MKDEHVNALSRLVEHAETWFVSCTYVYGHLKFWHVLTFERGLVLEATWYRGKHIYFEVSSFGDVALNWSVLYRTPGYSSRISVPLPHSMCTRPDR